MSEVIEKKELSFSKKQLEPLIKKFHISPSRNSKFKTIIDLFPNQTNYQMWAIKCLWNRFCTLEQIEHFKVWADENHKFIKLLSKKNIVNYYNSAYELTLLSNEMDCIKMINVVKNVISKFNTDQRNMLNTKFNMKEINGLSARQNSEFLNFYNLCNYFINLDEYKIIHFIKKASAITSVDKLINEIDNCIHERWMWDPSELIDFILNENKDCKIVYNHNNNIIVNINSFDSSKKICGGGRTEWCITRDLSYWQQYVTPSGNSTNKQYFMFDFNKLESNDLAMIGFTVNPSKGIIAAHTVSNKAICNKNSYYLEKENKYISIKDIFDERHIALNDILKYDSNKNYSWNINSLIKFCKDNNITIKYNKNNILIISSNDLEILYKLCYNTYINFDKSSPDKKDYCLMFDFNLKENDTNAIIKISIISNEYGTQSIKEYVNGYGIFCDEQLSEHGIQINDILNDTISNPVIKLRKAIDEQNEELALQIMEENPDMDINVPCNERLPICVALQNFMFKTILAILKNSKFNYAAEDGYGEIFTTDLATFFTYCNEDQQENFDEIMNFVLSDKRADYTLTNINNDTYLTSLLYDDVKLDKTNHFVKILLSKNDININQVNDMGKDALYLALSIKNVEIIKELLKRTDLIITSSDIKMALEVKINLDEIKKSIEENNNEKKTSTLSNEEIIKMIVTTKSY